MEKRDFLRAKGFRVVSLLFVLFCLWPLNLFGEEGTTEKPFKVEVKDGRVTVDVQDAEISDVLKEIEKGTSVKMTIDKALIGKKISIRSEASEVEDAIKTILNMSDIYYVLNFLQDPANKEKYILQEVKAKGDVIGSKPYKGNVITKDIPYGKGKEDVGAINEGEGALIGPKSFTVDEEGNIYICDTVNDRVQIYSPNGDYLSTIPFEVEALARDIEVGCQ